MYIARKKVNRRAFNSSKWLDRQFRDKAQKPCAWCGTKMNRSQATFDHVMPLSKGGYDKGKNGAISCLSCNSRKGSMLPDKFKKAFEAKK